MYLSAYEDYFSTDACTAFSHAKFVLGFQMLGPDPIGKGLPLCCRMQTPPRTLANNFLALALPLHVCNYHV